MTDRQLFKETFSRLHASEDTITEVLQMAREQDNRRKTRHPVRTATLIALAAVLLMGTAYAAVLTYRLRVEDFGDLAVAISVEEEGANPGAVAFSGEGTEEVVYHDLDIEAGWLPEGMVNTPGESIKWDYEDNGFRGGFSIMTSPLNTGNATFCDAVGDAEIKESLDIGGHEAFYIKQTAVEGFNQYLYVSYPEYNAVLTLYIGSNIDRDTAVKFAENLKITPSDRTIGAENLEYIGRRYQDMANFIATGVYVNTADEDFDAFTREEMEDMWAERDPANRAVKNNMADAHEIGESFAVSFMDFQGEHENYPFVDLTVKVTDISVRDDYSALRDLTRLDQDWASRVDENGKLPKEDYDFVVYGDGVNTPGVTVVDKLPDQQLYMVAATVEITNDTDETVVWSGYHGRLLSVAETPDGWQVTEPTPEDPTLEYDEGYSLGGAILSEMRYWDLVQPNQNGGNEIADLAPGESVTVQMGFVVSECQLGNLWFFMNDMDAETSQEIHVGYVPVPDPVT